MLSQSVAVTEHQPTEKKKSDLQWVAEVIQHIVIVVLLLMLYIIVNCGSLLVLLLLTALCFLYFFRVSVIEKRELFKREL